MQVALGILQRIGFSDIVCASDGVKAIAEIAARGGGEAFDIVLTDLHMPRKVLSPFCNQLQIALPKNSDSKKRREKLSHLLIQQ